MVAVGDEDLATVAETSAPGLSQTAAAGSRGSGSNMQAGSIKQNLIAAVWLLQFATAFGASVFAAAAADAEAAAGWAAGGIADAAPPRAPPAAPFGARALAPGRAPPRGPG